jgi:hypothetical protein
MRVFRADTKGKLHDGGECRYRATGWRTQEHDSHGCELMTVIRHTFVFCKD